MWVARERDDSRKREGGDEQKKKLNQSCFPKKFHRTVYLQHSTVEVFSLSPCVRHCHLGDDYSGDYLSVSLHLPPAVNTGKKINGEERKICLD